MNQNNIILFKHLSLLILGGLYGLNYSYFGIILIVYIYLILSILFIIIYQIKEKKVKK